MTPTHLEPIDRPTSPQRAGDVSLPLTGPLGLALLRPCDGALFGAAPFAGAPTSHGGGTASEDDDLDDLDEDDDEFDDLEDEDEDGDDLDDDDLDDDFDDDDDLEDDDDFDDDDMDDV